MLQKALQKVLLLVQAALSSKAQRRCRGPIADMEDDEMNPCSISDDEDQVLLSSPVPTASVCAVEPVPRSMHGVHFGRRTATAPSEPALEPEPEPEPKPDALGTLRGAHGFEFGRRAASGPVASSAAAQAPAVQPMPAAPSALPVFSGVTFGLIDGRVSDESVTAAGGRSNGVGTAGFSFGKSPACTGFAPVPKAPALPAELPVSTVDSRIKFGINETVSQERSRPFTRQKVEHPDKAKRQASKPGLGGFGFGGATTKLPPKDIAVAKTGLGPAKVLAVARRDSPGSAANIAAPAANPGVPVSDAMARPHPILKCSSSNKEDGAETDDEAELDKLNIREISSKSSGRASPEPSNSVNATQMTQMFEMMKTLTSTVVELKSEVETLRKEKNDAIRDAMFLSKQLSDSVRRTGDLQRFLSAELEQYQDVRESLMEIKSMLTEVRASSVHGSIATTAAVSSGSPVLHESSSSVSPSMRFGPSSPLPGSLKGLRAVALNQRRASHAGIAKASTLHQASVMKAVSSGSNSNAEETLTGHPDGGQANNTAVEEAFSAKEARVARQTASASSVHAAPEFKPEVEPQPNRGSAPEQKATDTAKLVDQGSTSPDRAVAPAARAHLAQVPKPNPASSPPRQRKKPLPTVDVDSSPPSVRSADTLSKLVPTPRDTDPIRVGHVYRACSRAVLRESADPRSLAMSQYDPPRLDALAPGDTVTLKSVERVQVTTKEGNLTPLIRVECELLGQSVGWTSVWAQNGRRLLDRVQRIKVIGLSGESVDVEVAASDSVGSMKKQTAPDASRALVVLDGEQLSDDTKMSAIPAGSQLRVVPRLGLKTPLRPPPSFHAQEDSMLTQLGEDLLEHVLRNLPSLQDKIAVTLSCRTLYSLRYVTSLWKTLDFSTPEDMTLLRFDRRAAILPKAAEEWHDTDDRLFATVAHVLGQGRLSGQYAVARAIRLQHCPRITDVALRCMAATYPQLSDVGLRGCKAITSAGIKVLVQAIGRFLEVLDIGFCDAALVDESVAHITKYCTALRSLVLRGGKRLDMASANLIARWGSAAQLRNLDLMGCLRLLYDVNVERIVKPLAQGLCSLNLSLRSADSNSRNPRDYHVSGSSHLSDACLHHLSKACPALTSLQLANGARLSDDAMVMLLSQLKSLKIVDLHGCVKLKGTHIVQAIADNIPAVEELTLSEWKNNLGNKTMALLASLQRLRKLDVHGNVCDHNGIADVCEGCSSLQDFTMSCQPHTKLTKRLAKSLADASLAVLTLIGVQHWWQEQPDDLVEALAAAAPPDLSPVGGRACCALATVVHLDCDADTVQELSRRVDEYACAARLSQGERTHILQGRDSTVLGTSAGSNLLPLNRSSHDELRGRLATTSSGRAR